MRVDPDGGFDGGSDPKEGSKSIMLNEVYVYANTLANNLSIDWHGIGYSWRRYLENPYNLAKDVNNSVIGLGSYLRTETYVNGYNSFKNYLASSSEQKALADARELNGMLTGALAGAPLYYLNPVLNRGTGATPVTAAKGEKELFKFTGTAAKHMDEAGRMIPVQTLDDYNKSPNVSS